MERRGPCGTHEVWENRASRQVPGVIHAVGRGEFDAFAQRELQQSIAFEERLSMGMFMTVTCAEDLRFVPEEDIHRVTDATFLGTTARAAQRAPRDPPQSEPRMRARPAAPTELAPQRTIVVLTCALATSAACGGGLDPEIDSCEGAFCDSTAIAALGLDPFYRKYLDAGGIPIVSSERVQDGALLAARDIVQHMLSKRPDVRAAMISRRARVGIMARTEVTTDIPEHRFLADDPDVDWDARARGLGGTPGLPITTVGEENLLCLAADRYKGEWILVHEFAHGMHGIGIDFVDMTFSAELLAIYDTAVAEETWAGTYAATNYKEYWAEGVQSWFDANQAPQPGIHNEIDTRDELEAADPRLAALIARYLPGDAWRPACPP